MWDSKHYTLRLGMQCKLWCCASSCQAPKTQIRVRFPITDMLARFFWMSRLWFLFPFLPHKKCRHGYSAESKLCVRKNNVTPGSGYLMMPRERAQLLEAKRRRSADEYVWAASKFCCPESCQDKQPSKRPSRPLRGLKRLSYRQDTRQCRKVASSAVATNTAFALQHKAAA